MTRLRFQGFEDARDAGLLDGSPDLRVALVGPAFDCPESAVHMDDVATLDEFTGVNYQRYDATTVAMGWLSNMRVWTCDNTGTDEFGTSVGPGTDPPAGMIVILHVDGTDPNDYILGYSDEGAFSDGNGADMGLTLPDDVILFSRSAPSD